MPLVVHIGKSSTSWRGVNSNIGNSATGRSSRARARNSTAASASSAIVQVNRKLFRNTSLSPSWFFSCDLPALAQLLFGARVDVAHIRHDQVRLPLPAPLAVNHTGLEKAALARIGGRNPTDQRHQQYAAFITAQPEPKGVLLVTDAAVTLPAFERPSSQRGVLGRIPAGALFLCPEQAAAKSVASIRASAGFSVVLWIRPHGPLLHGSRGPLEERVHVRWAAASAPAAGLHLEHPVKPMAGQRRDALPLRRDAVDRRSAVRPGGDGGSEQRLGDLERNRH